MIACALAASAGALGGCATESAAPEAMRPKLMSHAGPAGWEMRILQDQPPYGLVQYVEPALPGVPDAARGVLLVGKAWVRPGREALSGACEAQWQKELASPRAPVDRRAISARRAGALYTGWEAKRPLPEGSTMRLRALCGSSELETAFIYLSAPDRSSLYEPVWEKLLLLNLGSADEP